MPLWKQLLLATYYYGSWPMRVRQDRTRRRERMSPVISLFYHRIADDFAGAWTFPSLLFERQINWLRRRFDLISMEEAQRRLRQGHDGRPGVVITFDDGYFDNCQTALPLLYQWKIPCTYFVSTRHIVDGVPFAHDVSRKCPLRPNTIDQLRAMSQAGVEIGCHTRTHADLGRITDHTRLVDEVITAGEELQTILEKPVRYFAFPFGQRQNLNAEAFHLAYESGYEAVCSAYGGINFPGDDAFHIQRIPADPVMIRLKNWCTVDPRKLDITRYEYEKGRVVTDGPTASPADRVLGASS